MNRVLKIWLIVIIVLFNLEIAFGASEENDSINFINGIDVSFIPQIEDLGGVYMENGVATDPLTIFKNHGINYIRLKLWHTPEEDYNNLEKILQMALRIKEHDMKFLLNFHYSDTWADPGHQTKPAAWNDLDFETLKDSVYSYTKTVMQALDQQGTLPDMVQVGNEITVGMLWNDGKVGGNYDTDTQWSNFTQLVKAGIQGVRESSDNGDSVKIMIHIDRGGNNSGARWFYSNLISKGVDFDIIGLSYYPWWHGSLTALESNLKDLATRYSKEIIVAETAYPWTLNWYDNTDNIVGSSDDLLSGYPASVTGQKNFLRKVLRIVKNTPNEKGIGVFYWAPEYISVESLGSPWENLALFDFDGNALSSMDVFLEQESEQDSVIVTVQLNTSTLLDTLGESGVVQIRGAVKGYSYDILPDGRKITNDEDSDLIMENQGGDYWSVSFPMFPGDSLFFKFWTGFNLNDPTFQRLGWEGAIRPYGGIDDTRRVIVASDHDTTVVLQYINSLGTKKNQYWRPFEEKQDSIAILFRVNMSKAMASGRFDPDENGPVTVRGDSLNSNGGLSWNESLLTLEQEQYSVNDESFWSGVLYLPKAAITVGSELEYKFYIENSSQNGWEDGVNRVLKFKSTLIDTTLHWVYFDEKTAIDDDESSSLEKFQLKQNYPNPFNNQTCIEYDLASTSHVNLNVFDISGEAVAKLVDKKQSAGNYQINWTAKYKNILPLPSGIYFICLKTDYGIKKNKTLLLK